MDILGVSCYFHDSAAVLLRDGQLVAAAEEERFTRKKHDFDFPRRAIDFCLETGGIPGEALDYVVFFEKPFVKFERLLLTCLQTFPQSLRLFREAMIPWLSDKLWIRSRLQQELGVPAAKILFSEHHLSHAASAFLCSPFPEAAILTVDGVGEWTTASIGIGRGHEVRLLQEMRFPHSLGLLYSTFTAFLGFEVNEGEYKVMGMAPFGRPRYLEEVSRLLRVADDGSFELDMSYFEFHRSGDRSFGRKFVDLFGPPRDPRAPFFTRNSGYPSYFGPLPATYEADADRNEHWADLAASVQRIVEEVVLRMAHAAYRETGVRRLCMAGGVALNSVVNGRLRRETPFEEVYIQPAAGDSGGALGAALYAHHTILGQPRSFVMEHASWGQAHDARAVEATLAGQSIASRRFVDDEQLFAHVARRLGDGAVVGWFDGRFEWGPRALGHRSILADPRRAEMKDIVNTKIKYREPFRPFAPSVLTERASDYFALPDAARHYPARFMLYVENVHATARPTLPAVTHVDGTARLQTVRAETAPRFYGLIQRFEKETGMPVLLNTSFNLKGEPIVNTPAEALRTFAASDMDVLVLGAHVVEKAR